ncbi:hypothetical protein TanjilG_31100 [Lupinus angustifolius]|uniref:C2 domain-containing protein n=1 Tax=Lupinus angustifolius TaxID=3871 RepID=A0A394DD73_LUPAN|nr:PREDICTED: uncharacterized protein LOC109339572 [Lupinus angustifolius]OIW21232.1 hypothetical protein TanjilG_31100 [Lupinus angustifolius]
MSNILACYQLLELNVISAQDLATVGRSMRTYAVAWIDPDRKLSTRVDSDGHNNPTWNDKFVFRVKEDFFYEDTSLITIDIYALHWFKDIHVGTAEVLACDLFPPPSKPSHNTYKPPTMQFMGLEVHRASGHPKGIVNIGVVVLDSSMRSMPLYTNNTPGPDYHHVPTDKVSHQAQAYPKLRRTKSDTSSMIDSEAMAHEKRAKAKSDKTNSVISHSEVSTKSKKKTSSILSGSSVKATPKKGKFGKRKTKVAPTSPEAIIDDFNAMQWLVAPRKKVGYEAKPSPKPQFGNTPAMAYNATPIGAVRATPLHPFAKVNALEYGTPRRSNMRNMVPIMTDSELGPSASEVAAAVARHPVVEEGDNSTVGGWSLDESVEELQPKVERWRTDLAPVYDVGEMSSKPTSSSKKGRRSRRHTDGGGGNGLFSCFSVICGVECSIVCGGDGKKNRRRRAKSVDNNTSLL